MVNAMMLHAYFCHHFLVFVHTTRETWRVTPKLVTYKKEGYASTKIIVHDVRYRFVLLVVVSIKPTKNVRHRGTQLTERSERR